MSRDFSWFVCPVCKGLMLQKRGMSDPECDRCKQSVYVLPREISETSH